MFLNVFFMFWGQVVSSLLFVRNLLLDYGFNVFLAMVLVFVWFKVIAGIGRFVVKWLQTAKVDISLHSFLRTIVTVSLKILLFLSVLSMFWFETNSFVALFGAAWLALWLALQWSLSNFAAGVMVLLLKPYKVWDFWEFNGAKGTVRAIDVFTTHLISPENKHIIVPNSTIISANIVNHSKGGFVRVDCCVGIAYDADLQQAKKVLLAIMLDNPALFIQHDGTGVFVNEFADSSVNLIVRWYAVSSMYWDSYFYLMEHIKITLDKHAIEIPFPQRVIHTR